MPLMCLPKMLSAENFKWKTFGGSLDIDFLFSQAIINL